MIINKKQLILVLILSTGLIYQCQKKDSEIKTVIAKPVKVTTIGNPDEIITNKYPGKVEAHKDANLSFQISGVVTDLTVKKGQDVETGDVIARIDPVDYQLKHNETRAVLDERKITLDRTEKLLEKGFSPQAELDKVKAQYDIAKANFDLAEQNLKYTEITAPFDGRVADTFIENHQYINAKDPIVLLHGKDMIDIAIDVPESIVATIKEKKIIKRTASFDSSPDKEYDIDFNDIVLQADPQTQTYRVYMSLPTPKDINILPGMTATVSFQYIRQTQSQNIQSFLIPVTSIFTDENDNSFVWVIDSNTNIITARKITTGELKDNKIQVTSGITTGDTIVTAGVHLLREGQEIKPIKNK